MQGAGPEQHGAGTRYCPATENPVDIRILRARNAPPAAVLQVRRTVAAGPPGGPARTCRDTKVPRARDRLHPRGGERWDRRGRTKVRPLEPPTVVSKQ